MSGVPGYASMSTGTSGKPIAYRVNQRAAEWGLTANNRHAAYGADESKPWTRMSGGCKPGFFDVRRGHLHPHMGTCDAEYQHLVPHTLGPVPSHRVNPFPFTNVDPYSPSAPLSRNPLSPFFTLIEQFTEPYRNRNTTFDIRGQAPHPAPVLGDQLIPARVLAKHQYAIPQYGFQRLMGSYSDSGY